MPQLWKNCRGILLSVCPCVRASVCPFKILLSSVLKFHIWIPHPKIIDTYFFRSRLSPFVELCLFLRVTMVCFNQDISKTITVMSFKLGQVIEDNE